MYFFTISRFESFQYCTMHYNAANSYNEMRLQGRKKSSTVITAAETLTTKREMIHLYYAVIVRSIYNACTIIFNRSKMHLAQDVAQYVTIAIAIIINSIEWSTSSSTWYEILLLRAMREILLRDRHFCRKWFIVWRNRVGNIRALSLPNLFYVITKRDRSAATKWEKISCNKRSLLGILMNASILKPHHWTN